MRCYGCSSGCGSADRSSCAASGAIATSKANRKRLLRRKDFHDFSGKMRYSLFYRIRDTTNMGIARRDAQGRDTSGPNELGRDQEQPLAQALQGGPLQM